MNWASALALAATSIHKSSAYLVTNKGKQMAEKIERITLIAIITISIIVSVLDFAGVLDNISWLAGRTASFTLLLVAVIASYLVSERFGKLEKIEKSISINTEKLLSSLSGVEAKTIPTAEEALEYMATRVALAENKIDHAALAPPIPRRAPYSNKWEKSIEKVLKSNKVMYRYIASFSDKARAERVQNYVSNPSIQKYFVRFYELGNGSAPALSFVMIDDTEVIMHYPYEPGQSEVFLSIKHPDVVRLFEAYFRSLWNNAKKVDKDGIQEGLESKG